MLVELLTAAASPTAARLVQLHTVGLLDLGPASSLSAVLAQVLLAFMFCGLMEQLQDRQLHRFPAIPLDKQPDFEVLGWGAASTAKGAYLEFVQRHARALRLCRMQRTRARLSVRAE